MEKFLILKKNKHLPTWHEDHMKIIEETTNCKFCFLTLLQQEYYFSSLDKAKNYWSEKGANSGFQDGTEFMQDEPSGIIYCYDYFEAQKIYDNWYAMLTYEQWNERNNNPDQGPFIVDFIRKKQIPYTEKMHKNNFFELFEKWDPLYTSNAINYIVWYEDANDWVHLEGFKTEEQARAFIANN